ncbi:MAG: ATP-binding cassette, subfamily multidrug efflux pump [Eubacteriaceae bacterium]|nr:ATP-binding cassette, subfamily multidrug efflux pump [Eubacteriaceae bacterium]MDK2937085.1 ATP-binding cassette, subfamily multidrug efflux pump [Eubacteriaceae bacterium]
MRQSGKLDKPKNKKAVLRRLSDYLLPYKGKLLLAFILMLGSNSLMLVGPMLAGYAIDAIKPGAVDFSSVYFYAGLMVAFYLGSALLIYCLEILMINISRKVTYNMRKDTFNHLMDLPVGYFDSHATGDVISRISYDIDTINASLASDLVQMGSSFIIVTGSLAMMMTISLKLMGIFVVTVPISLLVSRYLVKKTRPLFSQRSKKLGQLNAYGEEMVTGIHALRVYGQEDNTIRNYDQKNQEAVDAYYQAEYHGSMVYPSVNLINNLSLSMIAILGAVLFLNGSMSIGMISSFILYSRKFSGPINEIANLTSDIQSSLAAAERVFGLLDKAVEKQDSQDAVSLSAINGQVKFENLQFGYEPEQIIIRNLNLKIHPGSLVAIVGPTGAGKTTIINLLMRFYDTNEGFIYIDGEEVRAIRRDDLRASFAMVLQDTWLFQGTIFENLAYGNEHATREQVIKAAKAARIHAFIQRLPAGYDTVLSEEGTNISKGQKQLLTIARAMLLEAKMLILDEATSNVDTRTEKKIQEAMRELMKDKTCFVIAHRLSTIENADLILVVDDGKIVEEGSHQELMAREGQYWRLYQAQYQ